MSIQLEGLSLAYRQGPALRFPDLELPDGRGLLLRGASGSGKSSLLALIAGLLTATEGRVLVNGVDLGALGPAERDAWRGANLGFVPQRLHLSSALSVQGNLELPFVAAGVPVDGARIMALLDELGLRGLAARRPHELSLGQAQRVALARALVRRPPLLLADEPTANLDDEAAAAVLELLRRTSREQGATLIIATHDGRVDRQLGADLQRQVLPKLAAAREPA